MDRIHFEISELNTDIISEIFMANDVVTISKYLTPETIVNIAKFIGLDINYILATNIEYKLFRSEGDDYYGESLHYNYISSTVCGVSVVIESDSSNIEITFCRSLKSIHSILIRKPNSWINDYYIKDLGSGSINGYAYLSIEISEEVGVNPNCVEIWLIITPSNEIRCLNMNKWHKSGESHYEVFDPETREFTYH